MHTLKTVITKGQNHKTKKSKRNSIANSIIKKKRLDPNEQFTFGRLLIDDNKLELLGRGASSIAFKVNIEKHPLILKRSRIHLEPNNKFPHELDSELAIYKYIDTLPILERQFLVKCYDWRVYNGCSYAARGLYVSDPMKPSRNPTTCIDMVLDYRGPSLADWLNSKYLLPLPQCKFKRKTRQEPVKLIYSIIWQLTLIFKILNNGKWLHIDAHPHNITVVNGLQLDEGYTIDKAPTKVHVPNNLLPDKLNGGAKTGNTYLPTHGIQIALIDYNLVLHPDYRIDIDMDKEFRAKNISTDVIEAMRIMELKRRILAIVFEEHKMMAETNCRQMPLRHFKKMLATNSEMAKRYPTEWLDMVSKLSNEPIRILLSYNEYLTDVRANMKTFKILHMRIENEIFWLWQLTHAAEICQLYGFNMVYKSLLPTSQVIELFFGENTNTYDNIIVWCCKKLN